MCQTQQSANRVYNSWDILCDNQTGLPAFGIFIVYFIAHEHVMPWSLSNPPGLIYDSLNKVIIGSHNGVSPVRRPCSCREMSAAKYQPFYLGLNVLKANINFSSHLFRVTSRGQERKIYITWPANVFLFQSQTFISVIYNNKALCGTTFYFLCFMSVAKVLCLIKPWSKTLVK